MSQLNETREIEKKQSEIDIVELMVARSKPIDDMVLCGDWNTAMERNNAQTNALRNFIIRNDWSSATRKGMLGSGCGVGGWGELEASHL